MLPSVTEALRQNGYTVSGDKAQSNYQVSVTTAGGAFDLSCTICLYEKDVPIISAKGVNPGWGVWLNRGGAYRGVFKGALKQFKRRLEAKE
jgi:hypothetical protein